MWFAFEGKTGCKGQQGLKGSDPVPTSRICSVYCVYFSRLCPPFPQMMASFLETLSKYQFHQGRIFLFWVVSGVTRVQKFGQQYVQGFKLSSHCVSCQVQCFVGLAILLTLPRPTRMLDYLDFASRILA